MKRKIIGHLDPDNNDDNSPYEHHKDDEEYESSNSHLPSKIPNDEEYESSNSHLPSKIPNNKKNNHHNNTWWLFDCLLLSDHPINGKKLLSVKSMFAIPICAILIALAGNHIKDNRSQLPPLSKTVNTSSIIHYVAIDSSDSARNDLEFTKTLQNFCELSSQSVQAANRYVEFASTQKVPSNLSSCPPSSGFWKDIEPGTSLINLLRYISAGLSLSEKDAKKEIMVTVLIHYEEPGANQLNTSNDQDVEKLIFTLSKLKEQSVTVVIISPVKPLIERLKSALHSSKLDNILVCPSHTQMENCIKQGFNQAKQTYEWRSIRL